MLVDLLDKPQNRGNGENEEGRKRNKKRDEKTAITTSMATLACVPNYIVFPSGIGCLEFSVCLLAF